MSRAVGIAVARLVARRIDALDGQFDQLQVIVEALTSQAYYGVQWHLHVWQILWALVQEVAQYATKHSLMRHHQDVVCLL